VSVLVIAGVGTLVAGTSSSSGTTEAAETPAATAAELASLELTATQAQIAQRFPFAYASESHVRIPLRDPRFDGITLNWNDAHDHVESMYFDPVAAVDRAPIVAALRLYLGHHFVDDTNGTTATWPPNGRLNVGVDGSMSWDSSPPDEGTQADWRGLARALWALVRMSLLGGPAALDEPTRELLAGYSLSRVAEVDITGVVDDAYRTVSASLPGASASISGGLRIDFAVDHPWFDQITLAWANEAGGRLETMQLWSVGDSLRDLDAISRCLTPVFGAPEITVTDHLRNERRFSWTPAGTGWWDRGIGAGGNNIHLAMKPAGPDLRTHFRAVLNTLAACGR
jgi:hypothetical protein